MSKSTEYIEVYGAREHNLKNINVKIPMIILGTPLEKGKENINNENK